MGELPKQLLAWLGKLLPQQKVRGNKAVQVGKVSGGLHTDHSTHNHAVHVTHVTHQHFYAGASAPQPAPVPQPQPASVATAPAANDGARQWPRPSEVLGLLNRLERPTYYRVLDFMRAEFGTAMVKELSGQQLYRLRRYVETIQRKEEKERA